MPKVTWTLNGSAITEKRIKEETIRGMTCLTVSKSKREDSGDYHVAIENELGSINTTIKLIVLGMYDFRGILILLDLTAL